VLNRRLASAAALEQAATLQRNDEYALGPGDLIEVYIFQVEELSRPLRVRRDGTISFPLLGSLEVAGWSTGLLERELARRLEAEYLNDPQVSILVAEYRSHPVTVLGEVNQPGVYYLRGPSTLLEILSEAGGLSEEAGSTVHLRRVRADAGHAEPQLELIAMDLGRLLEARDAELDLTLRNGDTVNVPRAGVVFVEGAVRNPGAYSLRDGATVLKAVTLAGGLEFSASNSSVQLIRANDSEPEIIAIDLGEISRHSAEDLTVHHGDVVVVGSSALKVGLAGLWRGMTTVMRVSAGF
jgi:polysaccharide export outer membrane protein